MLPIILTPHFHTVKRTILRVRSSLVAVAGGHRVSRRPFPRHAPPPEAEAGVVGSTVGEESGTTPTGFDGWTVQQRPDEMVRRHPWRALRSPRRNHGAHPGMEDAAVPRVLASPVRFCPSSSRVAGHLPQGAGTFVHQPAMHPPSPGSPRPARRIGSAGSAPNEGPGLVPPSRPEAAARIIVSPRGFHNEGSLPEPDLLRLVEDALRARQ